MSLLTQIANGDLGSAVRTVLNKLVDFTNGNDHEIIAGQYTMAHDYVTLQTGTAPVSTVMYLVPFKVRQTATLSNIATFVSLNMTSQVFALAVYGHNYATGRPTGAALGQTAFTLSAAATGVVDAPLSANVQLPGGIYWIALQVSLGSNTAQFQNAPGNWAGIARLLGDSNINNVVTAASSIWQGLTVTNTFGSWPDLTAAGFTFNQANRGAAYYLKFATVP